MLHHGALLAHPALALALLLPAWGWVQPAYLFPALVLEQTGCPGLAGAPERGGSTG